MKVVTIKIKIIILVHINICIFKKFQTNGLNDCEFSNIIIVLLSNPPSLFLTLRQWDCRYFTVNYSSFHYLFSCVTLLNEVSFPTSKFYYENTVVLFHLILRYQTHNLPYLYLKYFKIMSYFYLFYQTVCFPIPT